MGRSAPSRRSCSRLSRSWPSRIDEATREAFYHLWNIVGWHLGIGDDRKPLARDPDGDRHRAGRTTRSFRSSRGDGRPVRAAPERLKEGASRAGVSRRRSCRTSLSVASAAARGARRSSCATSSATSTPTCSTSAVAATSSFGAPHRRARDARAADADEPPRRAHALRGVADAHALRAAPSSWPSRSGERRGLTIDPHHREPWGDPDRPGVADHRSVAAGLTAATSGRSIGVSGPGRAMAADACLECPERRAPRPRLGVSSAPVSLAAAYRGAAEPCSRS